MYISENELTLTIWATTLSHISAQRSLSRRDPNIRTSGIDLERQGLSRSSYSDIGEVETLRTSIRQVGSDGVGALEETTLVEGATAERGFSLLELGDLGAGGAGDVELNGVGGCEGEEN